MPVANSPSISTLSSPLHPLHVTPPTPPAPPAPTPPLHAPVSQPSLSSCLLLNLTFLHLLFLLFNMLPAPLMPLSLGPSVLLPAPYPLFFLFLTSSITYVCFYPISKVPPRSLFKATSHSAFSAFSFCFSTSGFCPICTHQPFCFPTFGRTYRASLAPFLCCATCPRHLLCQPDFVSG